MNNSTSSLEAYADAKSSQGSPVREVDNNCLNIQKTNARAVPKSDSPECVSLDLGDDPPEWGDLFAPSVLAEIDLSTPSRRKSSDKSTESTEKGQAGESNVSLNDVNKYQSHVLYSAECWVVVLTMVCLLGSIAAIVLFTLIQINTKMIFETNHLLISLKDKLAETTHIPVCWKDLH